MSTTEIWSKIREQGFISLLDRLSTSHTRVMFNNEAHVGDYPMKGVHSFAVEHGRRKVGVNKGSLHRVVVVSGMTLAPFFHFLYYASSLWQRVQLALPD